MTADAERIAETWEREVTVTLNYPFEHPMNAYVRGLERDLRGSRERETRLAEALREAKALADGIVAGAGVSFDAAINVSNLARAALAASSEPTAAADG